MKRTLHEVLEELQTDFRDLKAYIDEHEIEEKNSNDGFYKEIIKSIINDYLIPELKELLELLDD
jgi:hypothetical protein